MIFLEDDFIENQQKSKLKNNVQRITEKEKRPWRSKKSEKNIGSYSSDC